MNIAVWEGEIKLVPNDWMFVSFPFFLLMNNTAPFSGRFVGLGDTVSRVTLGVSGVFSKDGVSVRELVGKDFRNTEC